MSQLIPFESAQLPSFLTEGFGISNDLLVSGMGYPTVSIKGKVFTLKRGDEKTLITKPDAPDEPAASLEVIILRAGPAGDKLSKVYYPTGYSEGSDAKPSCYSNDGVAPSINAAEPQAKTCQACPHNAWGSHVSEDGKKGKACSDSKRLAVAPAGQINDPMLLRVPAASLKALTQFGQQLAKRGVPYQAVVAKIGFDYTVAHPALTFKPIGFVGQSDMNEIKEMMESDVVKRITGLVEDVYEVDAGESFESAPATKKSTTSTQKAPPKRQIVEDDDPPPKVKVAVEDESPKAAEAKKSAPAVQVSEIEGDIDDALDNLDFDD